MPTANHPDERSCSYLQADCSLTLDKALQQYRRSNPDQLEVEALQEPARTLFRQHDLAHVVFGCDNSLHDEVLIDVWTLAGSDVTTRDYKRYLELPEVKNLLKESGWRTLIGESLRALPDVFRVLLRARRMHKPWPFQVPDTYLQRPLSDLRDEFGIEVLG